MRIVVSILLVYCLLVPVSHAQEKAGSLVMEQLYVTTDRELYITGETVNMKVFSLNRLDHKPGDLSGVIYSEITDKYNNPAVQIKSDFNGNTGIASFRIPDTLATGLYYIRSFTSRIKNFPQNFPSYKKIAVVNPYSDFTLLRRDSINSITETFSGISSGDLSVRLRAIPEKPVRRERVRLELSIKDSQGKPVEGEFTLSVAKRLNISAGIPPGKIRVQNVKADGNLDYSPETGGYVISGTIWNRTTGQPLAQEPLSMGIAGKIAHCSFMVTDKNGEFRFRTDVWGKNILVIQPLNPLITDYIVELKDPFPPQSGIFRPEPLQIDSVLATQIDRAIVAAQVSRIYAPQIALAEKNGDKARDFFGQPDKSVRLSGYIELRSLQEVIRELVPGVMVNKKNGKDGFRIINKYPTGQFTTSPLVLLDGVPVYDISQLLAFSPAEIEKIDIINTRYYYGSMIFEGIIHIVSRRGDLKLYEFPEAVFRQEHEFLQEYIKPAVPDYSSDLLRNSRIPDTRNTLFWEPIVKTDSNGSAILEFFTGDEPGDYDISLEGFSNSGIFVKSIETLVIRSESTSL